MKAPVGGVIIFRLALPAHLKVLHGRLGPVIGDVIDNGISGTAIGAVYKGVAMPPISGIEHFIQAVIANADIRRYQGCHCFIADTFDYRKPGGASSGRSVAA
jgi:hypothetical protein